MLQIRLTRRMMERLKRTARQREMAVGEYVRVLILMDREKGMHNGR